MCDASSASCVRRWLPLRPTPGPGGSRWCGLQTGEQVTGGLLKPRDVVEGTGHEHRPLQAAHDHPGHLSWRTHKREGSFATALFEDARNPAFVFLEESNYGVLHGKREGFVLCGHHSAQAHAMPAQDFEVEIGIGIEPSSRFGGA